MENPSRKCKICAVAGPNQTKLPRPRHYIRRTFKAETHLELSGEDLCEKMFVEKEDGEKSEYLFSMARVSWG